MWVAEKIDVVEGRNREVALRGEGGRLYRMNASMGAAP